MMKQIPKVWFNLLMVGLIGFVGLVGCDSSVSSQAFLDAAYKGDKATIETYIENGGDVNAKDGDGNTPLNWAKTDEIKQLLKNAMK